jgi:hypothetical protein
MVCGSRFLTDSGYPAPVVDAGDEAPVAAPHGV